MRLENISVKKLIPYENNPRKNEAAVEYVANSIREFGFRIPLVIDKNNVIVCGHTRLKAALQLGLDKVPCLRAADLSDEQIKAFRIADNSTAEVAEWDFDKLRMEVDALDFDMEAFGELHIPDEPMKPVEDEDGYYGDERERTFRGYNLDISANVKCTDDFWQMPIIRNNGFIPDDLIGFNYALSSKRKNVGIHFYIDDYQFERVWNNPEKYIDVFMEYDCILTPDFSLYTDMTMPTKIWNIYRSRLIGAYYQSFGINVIPTISWAEPETFEFCFKGIPKKSIVSISTIGVKEKEENYAIWKEGCTEMQKQIEPSAILVYGGKIDFDYGNINVRYYDNHVIKNWEKEK